jgi:tRNA modification GTPase
VLDAARETIFAPASGGGAAAVAVIRLSGPAAAAAVTALAGPPPPPRVATLRRLTAPGSGETLDSALVLWFPPPASYTGEAVAELHVHGGMAVLQGVLDALAGLPGLRLAEPGEFTRRAFENGKLDLTAAEGVADLVSARTAGQRRQALGQLAGGLGRRYEAWRGALARALAYLEADIDFPDEDLPAGVSGAARAELDRIRREIAGHIDDEHRGERVRDGFRIAIIGAPNVGKSSLLNRLAQRDAAIVSTSAGTTRDVVEVRMDLAGYEVVLADTAGLRDSDDMIEREGVRRARAAAEAADMRLAVVDATEWPRVDPAVRALIDTRTLTLCNKVDLLATDALAAGCEAAGDAPVRLVSARTGYGIDALMVELRDCVVDRLGGSDAPPLTRARHREALTECRDALDRAAGTAQLELAAEDVRLAVRALGRITGRVDIDDVLDVIFRDFCIGK